MDEKTAVKKIEDAIAKHLCPYCGQLMKNYVPQWGKFKGITQKHEFVCSCEKFPKNLVMCIGGI